MNFPQGHSGTEVSQETPEFTKMGEIHELLVLALSLVWFAGATPDRNWSASPFFHTPETLWNLQDL